MSLSDSLGGGSLDAGSSNLTDAIAKAAGDAVTAIVKQILKSAS